VAGLLDAFIVNGDILDGARIVVCGLDACAAGIAFMSPKKSGPQFLL
jgi:hypothetical protein